MRIQFLRSAFIFAFLAVLFGAFAAHMLKGLIEPGRVAIFETGVRYQFYHALALGLTGLLPSYFSASRLRWAGRLFILGILCFSGSLYLLALRDLWGIAHWWWLGPVTPIGGTFFLSGWLFLILASYPGPEKKQI